MIDTSRDENKSIIFKPIGKNEINHKCKYIALKRCIINIINNAKAYGDKIIIKLSESDNKININIEDKISAFVKLDILLMYINSIIGSTNILESKNPRKINAVTDNAMFTFP